MSQIEARIIGLGNRLRGDDAVGPIVAERVASSGLVPDGVEAVEAGGDPMDLLDLLVSCRRAVVVDACEMGEAPGTVRLVDAGQIATLPGRHMSLHAIGLADVMKMAKELAAGTHVSLLAVQPAECGYTEGLSPEVEQRLSEITSLAIKEVLK